MRRPLLLILYIQVAIILALYYLNPFGLSALLDKNSTLLYKDGEVISVEGTVKKVQIKSTYTAVTVVCGQESLLVRLSGVADGSNPDSDAAVYDLVGRHVSLTGKISLPSEVRNPNAFNYRLYLKGQNVYSIMDVSKYRIVPGKVILPVSHLLSKQKGIFYKAVRENLDDQSFSILAGLLFGDKSYMDDELYESFQTNGIAHILAVSGLHVNLVYTVIETLLKGKKNRITSLLTVIILYMYASLSNFSISVLRASCMILLKLIAYHINRKYDMVCSASLTAIIFLLFNPYLLFDSGFQLSFTAAYIMGIALPFATVKFRKISNILRSERFYSIGKLLIAPLIIQLGMLPLTTYHFLNLSIISLFINPFAIALAGLILPAGLIPFAMSFVFPDFITAVSSGPVMFFIKILTAGNTIAGKSGLSFSCCSLPVHYVILFYIIFFWYFSETRVMLNRRKLEYPLAFISLAIILFWAFMPKGYTLSDVCFLDVGQGDCCLINIDGYHILIDGGGSYFKNVGKNTIKPILLKNGINKIDLAIVSHNDRDHSKGIYELKDCFKIDKIIDDKRENENCLVCSIEINGMQYLFMGDADISLEKKLLKKYPDLSCDVIKLGHHGSKTSSSAEFIEAVAPSFAIISCGLNNSYGHPSSGVIELLEKSGIIYGRTDLNGAICIQSNDNEIIAQNASKDKTWHIVQNKQLQSTLQKQ